MEIVQNIARVKSNSDIVIFQLWGPRFVFFNCYYVLSMCIKKEINNIRRLSNTYRHISSSNNLEIFQNIARVKNNSNILIIQKVGRRYFKNSWKLLSMYIRKNNNIRRLSNTYGYISSSNSLKIFQNIAGVKNSSNILMIQRIGPRYAKKS